MADPNDVHLYYNYPCVSLSLFANGRSQFLLDRLGRCLKLFASSDSTSCHEFASQFGLYLFYTPKPRRKRAASASVYFNSQRPALSPAERAVTVGRQRIAIACTAATATAVCVCPHARACVRAHACACVRACVRACVMCFQYTIIIFYPRW